MGEDAERFEAVLVAAEEALVDLSRVRDRLVGLAREAPWVLDRRYTAVADAADACVMAHEWLSGFVGRGRWVAPESGDGIDPDIDLTI